MACYVCHANAIRSCNLFLCKSLLGCRSHSALPSRHASASPAPRASLRQSRAGPRGCCRVRPHPTTLRAVVTFFYAAAYSACRSHSALPSRHAVASPAPGASLRQSRASTRGCCRVRPHPTTLNAVVTFSYAAACSACRRQRGFVLTPCGRVTSRPAGESHHALLARHLPPCGRITCPPAGVSPAPLHSHPGLSPRQPTPR